MSAPRRRPSRARSSCLAPAAQGAHRRPARRSSPLRSAFSAILVRKAGVAPETSALYRCAYALPLLWWLSAGEDRAYGRRGWRERRLAVPAGIFFAADLIFWHHAIGDVGAGLATVLGNLQVVVVPFAAWALLGERVPARIRLALQLAGGACILGGLVAVAARRRTGRAAVPA